jgi:hypothetical protein
MNSKQPKEATMPSTTTTRTRIAVVLAAMGLIAAGASPAALAQHPRQHHRGIPQHNRGDHDADNNGGPSDGDGGV